MARETQRRFLLSAVLLLPALICVQAIYAQDAQQLSQPSPTPLTAPPPLKTIAAEERGQIEQTRDSGKRVRMTIDFAAVHLTKAEQHTTQENFDAAAAEVGMYHALIENAFEFLSTFKRDSNKTRDNYKRLELALRSHGPRLTNIRRTTPLEFAVWIKKVEDFAREGRTEALNSFYGHTVVREKTDKNAEKPKETPTPKSNTP